MKLLVKKPTFWMTWIILTLLLLGFQSSGITVDRNRAVADYPQSITFELSVSSDVEIESVELEYGTDALVCGESVSRVVPEDFSPGTSIEIEWDWDLRRTGALPPGTNVWWRWIVSSSSGESLITPEQSLRFTNESIAWRTLETDSLLLFWQNGSTSFAQALMDAGEKAMVDLSAATGVDMEEQIEVYIYASSEAMQMATLFAPAWSGGLAFSDHRAVLIGIPTTSLEWGKRAFAHELSHVVIGYYTFTCIGSLPIWLNEGLAEYAEGDMEPYYIGILSDAIEEDSLLSVRELGQIFSNDRDLAQLSYAQSQSLVEYLIENFGQEKMLLLLGEFREGAPEDRALSDIYGMDRDGLEAAWRESVGADPMQGGVEAGATPTRTPFPTISPITGPNVVTETPLAPIVPTNTPTPLPASTTTPTEQPEIPAQSNKSIIPIFLVICILVILMLALTGWFLWRRRKAS